MKVIIIYVVLSPLEPYMRIFIDVYLLKLLLTKIKPYAIDIIHC